MFSSSNNINPFPNLPSSSTFQVPFVDGEAAAAAGYFPFHHHHHDPLLAGYLVPVGPNYNPGAAISHHGLMGELSSEGRRDQGHHGGGDGKKAARKDRHSKISTSQGLRDRRVRLSIGISREFFDLQDMLGYDTASKTLEWLLGKSRKDIEELEEQIKNNRTKNSSSSSFELDPELNEEEEPNNPSEKKVKKSPKDVFAKESRAKARERARVRTREKLCTSSSTSSPTKSCPPPDHCHHHHHHHNQQYGFTQLASHNVNNMASFLAVHEKPSSSSHRPFTLHHHQQHQHLREDLVSEEAILIQRKFMRPAPESAKGFVEWDISNAIRRSTISGSTNLSTELQMYGNP